MNESQWDEKVRAFLKKTGEDLKRAGTDIKGEAEKLMAEVKDPDRQEKVKKGLESFRLWARKTAEEVAGVVETGVKKAEGAVRNTMDPSGAPPPAATAPSPPPPAAAAPQQPMRHDTPVDTPVAKTIGGAKKKGGSKAKAGSKKPLGKKRTP